MDGGQARQDVVGDPKSYGEFSPGAHVNYSCFLHKLLQTRLGGYNHQLWPSAGPIGCRPHLVVTTLRRGKCHYRRIKGWCDNLEFILQIGHRRGREKALWIFLPNGLHAKCARWKPHGYSVYRPREGTIDVYEISMTTINIHDKPDHNCWTNTETW